MFESIAVRGLQGKDGKIDAGLLAEILLFYQNTHLILQRGTLTSLLKRIGADDLLYLITNKFIRASFFRQTLGTYTSSQSGIPVHDFVAIEKTGSVDKGKFKQKDELIIDLFEHALGNTGHARRAAKQFLSLVPIKTLSPGFHHPRGIPGLARDDLDDEDYVQSAIEAALFELVPGLKLPARWHFKVIKIKDGFIIDTNLNCDELNSQYHKFISPKHSSIAPAFLIDHILEARADICLSSSYNSEFVATPTSSKIMQMKFSNLLERRFKNVREIELFQDVHLENVRAIRNSINSGERSFRDFITILEKSAKFKAWLREADPDIGLLTEYHKAVTARTWADKLPTKTVRFVIFSGAGVLIDAVFPTGLGTVAGVTLGAADTFVVDRLLKGWRPNHFIEDQLMEFTS